MSVKGRDFDCRILYLVFVGQNMNKKEEGLFGVCNEAHIVVIWVLLFILICGLVGGLEKTNNLKEKIKNLEKKVEESVDIQKTYVIIETYKN